jgi:hypothetical protein
MTSIQPARWLSVTTGSTRATSGRSPIKKIVSPTTRSNVQQS